jgi:hypothetical protein
MVTKLFIAFLWILSTNFLVSIIFLHNLACTYYHKTIDILIISNNKFWTARNYFQIFHQLEWKNKLKTFSSLKSKSSLNDFCKINFSID